MRSIIQALPCLIALVLWPRIGAAQFPATPIPAAPSEDSSPSAFPPSPALLAKFAAVSPHEATLPQTVQPSFDALALDPRRDASDEQFATSTAAPTIEERLAAVESELKKQLEAAAKKKDADSKKPTFSIGGQLQVDYLWVSQDQANRATVGDVNDAVDVRRARLGGRGEAFDVIEYIIGFDFALSGRPTFLDVWVGARDLPYLGHLRAGHFFEPFSLERMTQNQRLTFLERSLADAFAPARNVGIEAYDALGEDDRMTYAIGWFASNSGNFGEQFTDAGGQAVTTRGTWLPFWDDATDGAFFMHVGGAYSYRTPPTGTFSFSSFPEARSGTPTLNSIPTFVNTGIIAADHDQLFGVEFACVAGPLYIQSEYMTATVDQNGGPNVRFDGAYVNVSYFLTGEHRTYNKAFGIIDRVFPFENFFHVRTEDNSIATGKGAWEIAARASYIDLNDENILGGREHNYTLGLSWYLNAYTRVKWELIQANLNRAPVGESQAYIAGMRFDIDF